jgi:hypothetical protein
MAVELKDWLSSINLTKTDLSENIKDYPAFIVNRILSGDIGCVALVNELNKRYTMPADMQYKFLLHTVPKKKRYNPYIKKDKIDYLEDIKEYFNVSTEKAKEYLEVLDTEQIISIKKQLFKGGRI